MPQKSFFRIFGLLSYRYNLHQVGLEFRQLFDILVHPTAAAAATIEYTFEKLGYPLDWGAQYNCQNLKGLPT